MELIQALKNIGCTQQEAIIYIELCHHHEMTGYEAAKQAGISRSNAYSALSSLVDKGYAYTIEGDSVKYSPVPKEEMLLNAKRDFDNTIKVIQDKLDMTAFSKEPYLTVTDEKHIIDKLKNMINHAELRVYLSCDAQVLHNIDKELRAAAHRGLKIVILTDKRLKDIQYQHYDSDTKDSIKIIVDTEEVMAGTLKQCLYSKNTTLVHLIREAFVNEITLKDKHEL